MKSFMSWFRSASRVQQDVALGACLFLGFGLVSILCLTVDEMLTAPPVAPGVVAAQRHYRSQWP